MGSFCRLNVRKPLLFLVIYLGLCLWTSTGATFPVELIKTIGVKEGLSQSTVYDIVQDRDGYIWAATGEGLNRYDGFNFKTYYKNIQQPNGLKANMIRGLLSDDNGGLWIGTDKSIYFKKYRTELFKEYRINPKYDKLIYLPLFREGSMLTGYVQGHAFFQLNLETNVFKVFPYEGLTNSRVVCDKVGNFWFVDKNHILVKFPSLEKKPVFVQLAKGTYSVGSDRNKNIYTLMENGIYQWNTQQNKGKFMAKLSLRKDLLDINLFECTSTGVWLQKSEGTNLFYSYKSNRWEEVHINENGGTHSPKFYKIFEDKSSTLWMASNEDGIIQLSPYKQLFDKFQTTIEGNPATDFIKCFAQHKTGHLLVGTHNEGILEYTPDLKKYTRIMLDKSSIAQPFVMEILTKNQEDFWIATQKGLYAYNRHSGVRIIEPNHYYTGFTRSGSRIFLRRNGYFFPFNATSGQWDSTGYTYPTTIRFTVDLGNNTVFAAHKMYGASIIRFQEKLGYTPIHTFENLRIFSLYQAKSNLFYLTTDIGVIETDSNFKILHQQHLPKDIPQRHIYGLLEGTNGDLWASTNKGLLRIRSAQNRTQIYTPEHGLQSMEFNSEAFFKDKYNRLFFGGIHGFNCIDLNSLIQRKNIIPVFLSELDINHQNYPVKNIPNLSLPGKKHDLQVSFSTPEYIEPEHADLFIKIRGLHSTWIDLKSRRNFLQGGMPPGNYTLLAKTRNADGYESPEVVLMYMKIDVPFLRKPLNIVLLFAISLLFITGIIRRNQQLKIVRLQKEQELELVRKNIYRDLHDELGSGLSRIKMLSDLALLKQENLENPAIHQVSEAAAEVTEKLREIVWSMNPRNENLAGVLLRLQANTEEILKYLPLQYEFHVPEYVPQVVLPPGIIRNLLFVHKEAMHNIQKYSQASKVDVSFSLPQPGELNLVIADNGIGFDVFRSGEVGNGLNIMKARLEETGGQFSCHSVIGQGTTITLKYQFNPNKKSHS